MTMCLICYRSTVEFPGSTSVIFGSTDVFYALGGPACFVQMGVQLHQLGGPACFV